MRVLGLALLFVVLASEGKAACYGSSPLSTCDDQYGNSYTVQRFGNQTIMNGYNAQTGKQLVTRLDDSWKLHVHEWNDKRPFVE